MKRVGGEGLIVQDRRIGQMKPIHAQASIFGKLHPLLENDLPLRILVQKIEHATWKHLIW